MTAAAELGEQLNADAESSVVEIGSAELGGIKQLKHGHYHIVFLNCTTV